MKKQIQSWPKSLEDCIYFEGVSVINGRFGLILG